MNHPQLIRYWHPESGTRLGCKIGDSVFDLHPYYLYVHDWLKASIGRLSQSIEYLNSMPDRSEPIIAFSELLNAPDESYMHLLAPVDEQEIWAAGVTYERSREARQQEAIDGGDVYARVYGADRPELFFKAPGRKVVGNLEEVGIRADATWSVPEPELGLVMNGAMEVVGFTIGNDMSSRDIEGANPLYLPQAKVYTASCSIGPGLMIVQADDWLDTTIKIRIERGGQTAFDGEISTSRIHRKMHDLVEYLGRSNSFPDGVILLTGTGVVPPNDFTLAGGDVITITIDPIGTLQNTVKVV